MSRQTKKEQARDRDSAESMAFNSAAHKECSAVSLNKATKLHPQAAGTTRRVLNAEGINSCPRPASRNEVGAKRHE